MTLAKPEFLKLNGEIERKSREQKALSGEMSGIKRRAKDLGMNMRARDIASRIAGSPPGEAKDFLNTIYDYLEALGVPYSAQLVRLQGDDPTASHSDAYYYSQGFLHAVQFKDRDHPPGHVPESPAVRHYEDGYAAGLKERDGHVNDNVAALKKGIKQLEPETEEEDPRPRFLKSKEEQAADDARRVAGGVAGSAGATDGGSAAAPEVAAEVEADAAPRKARGSRAKAKAGKDEPSVAGAAEVEPVDDGFVIEGDEPEPTNVVEIRKTDTPTTAALMQARADAKAKRDAAIAKKAKVLQG